MSWGDAFLGAVVLMTVASAVSAVWNWWTGRRPGRDERIRAVALDLAVASHGQMAGEDHGAYFCARARVFERYLRTGDHKEAGR